MRRSLFCALLMFALCARSIDARALVLPESSAELSPKLALDALTLCTGHTKDKTAALYREQGIEVLEQARYDKAAADPSHTVAYTIGRTSVVKGGLGRTLYVAAMRGTSAGEWYSNFDFAPSRSSETLFSENFLFAAEDVFLALEHAARETEAPLFLLCGHSRGAACANLLSMLLSVQYGEESVYAYTYATPTTLRSAELATLNNTFNFINPADLVPRMPLGAWGYIRAGRDILLPFDHEKAAALDRAMLDLLMLAPDIEAYYGSRHSLVKQGTAEDGMTAYEVMLLIASKLSGLETNGEETFLTFDDMNLENTDFAVLARHLAALTADGGRSAAELMKEHMPERYAALLDEYFMQKRGIGDGVH